MKCKFNNSELTLLAPEKVRAYMHGTGWYISFQREGTFDVYSKEGVEAEIVVPKNVAFSDYGVRMQEMMEILVDTEKRSAIDIHSDIHLMNASDSISYRIVDSFNNGTISLATMEEILESHRRISASAYMDVAKPGEKYHKSCLSGFTALKNLRMGQTSYGSYVVRFLYSQNADSQSQVRLEGDILADPIILKLATKTIESSRVIRDAVESGKDDLSDSSISYNFVDSLIGLRCENNVSKVEMSKHSFANPESKVLPVDLGKKIFFGMEAIADNMKPAEPSVDRVFQGWLSRAIKNSSEESEHTFKLTFLDDQSQINAEVALSGSEMNAAYRSMEENKFISIKGTLTGYASKKTIVNTSDFRVIE
jgi:hypothetical protein